MGFLFNQAQAGQGQQPQQGGMQQMQPQQQGGGQTPIDMALVGQLLMGAGTPYSAALIEAAKIQREQQLANIQQGEYELKKQQFLQSQGATNQLINDISGVPFSSNPSMYMSNGSPTLGDLNANPMSGANTNLPTMGNMGAPGGFTNTVSSQGGINPIAATGKGLYANIDPQTRQMAINLLKAGDKAGALKLLNDARTQELPEGFIKNQMITPGRGSLGGTVVNPQTGESRSINTPERTTADQLAVAAVDRAMPQLEKVIELNKPFLQESTRALTWGQGVANQYLNTNFELPSKKAGAEAQVNLVAESLLKGFGLSNNDLPTQMIKATITPVLGESPQGYEKRVREEMTNLVRQAFQAKQRLAYGTVVVPPNQSQGQNTNMPIPGQNSGASMPTQSLSRGDQARSILKQRGVL